MYRSNRKFIDYKEPLTICTQHGEFTIYIESKADQPKRLWCPFCGTELDLTNLPEIDKLSRESEKRFLESQEKMIEKVTKKEPPTTRPILKKNRKVAAFEQSKKTPKQAKSHPRQPL